jgi:hypothetical protein
MKALLIVVLVIAGLAGLLLTLRTRRNAGTPSADVLARAQERAREQAAAEKRTIKTPQAPALLPRPRAA